MAKYNQYNIPVSRMEELTKKINHIKNKGAKVVFNIGKEVVVEFKLPNDIKVGVKCMEVEIEGQYIVDDWHFVGTIEHADEKNIIRLFDISLGDKIPTKYRTVGAECKHCHQSRDRKDTYLVYNDKTEEFKQVGRTCLRGYTNGLDAEKCALFADVFNYFQKLENEERETINSGGFSSGFYALKTDDIKKTIYGYVKKDGYVPQDTARFLVQVLSGAEKATITDASDSEVEEMNKWVNEVDTSSNYMWNAKTAWNKKYAEYRDVALLASLVSVYLKDKAKRAVKASSSDNSSYVGNVGDKIVIKNIKSIRTLYTKGNSQYSRYAPESAMIEIIDADGHIFIWSTSNSLAEHDSSKIESISATVKEHKEYKGVKQTVITRGKIDLKELPKELSQVKGDGDNMKDIFNFLSSLDD